MKRRRLSHVLVITGGAAFLVGAALTTQAHQPIDWYPVTWGPNHRTVGWQFVNDFQGESKRERVKDGSQQWNALSGNMNFHYRGGEGDYAPFSADSCPSTVEKNGIHWGPISGSTVAFASICTFQEAGQGSDNENLHSFQIKFDSGESWHGLTETPVPAGKLDMWSVASHEFGHATGRGLTNGGIYTYGGDGYGHFQPESGFCTKTNEDFHTMCQGETDRSWARTLETHDKDVFNDAYAN